MPDKSTEKYMRKSEIITFGIGLFGVFMLCGPYNRVYCRNFRKKYHRVII